jgi:hypothetical protein
MMRFDSGDGIDDDGQYIQIQQTRMPYARSF